MSRAGAQQDKGSPCPSPHPITPMGAPKLPNTAHLAPPPLYSHPSGEPRVLPSPKSGHCEGTATPTLLQQQALHARHSLPPSLSLEQPWVCPCSVSSGQLAVRAAVPWRKGRTDSLGTGSLAGSRCSPSLCPRVSRGLAGCQGGSHPGCCACREGRSAAAGARDPHSPGGTHGSRAAPAATASREVGTCEHSWVPAGTQPRCWQGHPGPGQ